MFTEPPGWGIPRRKGKGYTPVTRKEQVREAFGLAAATYDQHAQVQRHVAGRLAERIAALPLPEAPRVLEIGCGTGLLHGALTPRLSFREWVFSDFSPAMVAKARERFGAEPGTRYIVMDGEQPCFPPQAGFDLICSSLSFQWFEHLEESVDALRRLLAPGGWLAFSTMAAHSFHEWRQAHSALGLEAATPRYPAPSELAALWPGACVEEEHVAQTYASGRDFLRQLKGIGAQVPASGRPPLTAGELARVIRRFETEGARSTYHIAYCMLPSATGL